MEPATLTALTTFLTTILPIVVGPGGAIAICFMMLGFCGWVTIKHIIPSIERRFLDQQKNLASLMVEHRADRDVFKDAISTLTLGQTAIQSKMQDLTDDVRDLSCKVEDVGDRLKDLDKDVSKIRDVKRLV